jgi:hypothetical protein
MAVRENYDRIDNDTTVLIGPVRLIENLFVSGYNKNYVRIAMYFSISYDGKVLITPDASLPTPKVPAIFVVLNCESWHPSLSDTHQLVLLIDGDRHDISDFSDLKEDLGSLAHSLLSLSLLGKTYDLKFNGLENVDETVMTCIKYETFWKLANAATVEGRIGTFDFSISTEQLNTLRGLAWFIPTDSNLKPLLKK